MRLTRKKCKNHKIELNPSLKRFLESVDTSEQECCHTVDTEQSTLIMSSKTTMVHPPLQTGYCSICKGFFTFTKDEKGNWIIKN